MLGRALLRLSSGNWVGLLVGWLGVRDVGMRRVRARARGEGEIKRWERFDEFLVHWRHGRWGKEGWIVYERVNPSLWDVVDGFWDFLKMLRWRDNLWEGRILAFWVVVYLLVVHDQLPLKPNKSCKSIRRELDITNVNVFRSTSTIRSSIWKTQWEKQTKRSLQFRSHDRI